MSADRDDEPRSEVDDEEGLVARRRKEEIRDCRQEIRQVSNKTVAEKTFGRLSDEQAELLYGQYVREYLMCVEPLLRDSSLEKSEYLFEDTHLGTVKIEPPEKLAKAANTRRGADGIRVISNDSIETEEVPIHGLRSIIELEVVGAAWGCQVQFQNESPPRQTVREERKEPMPRRILERAVRETDAWLKDIGIGLDTGEGDPHGLT